MKLGTRAKLILLSFGLIAVSHLAADAYLTRAVERDLSERLREDLFTRCALVSRQASVSNYDLEDRASWDRLAGELASLAKARVTFIRRDGQLLGDSEQELSALHQEVSLALGPDVIAALDSGRGAFASPRDIQGKRVQLVAMPFERAQTAVGVARIATSLDEVDQAVAQARRLLVIASLIAFGIAVLVSSLAAEMGSRAVRGVIDAARRMAQGDLKTRTRASGRSDYAELGRTLDQLASSLSLTLDELRSERDLLDGVLASMQEGVLLLDGEGRIALFNPAIREMLMLAPDVRDQSLLETVRHSGLKDIFDRARSTKTSAAGEIEMAGIKPRQLLVHVANLGAQTVGRASGGLLLVFVDVTEIRRLESVRRDFVANVSHELRTPVAAVQSAAETLRFTGDDLDATRRFLDIIERNARRLAALIEDLLDLSRIESPEFQLHLERLDLDPIVSRSLASIREAAERKRIRLTQQIPPELPPLSADRRALDQVLTNLLDNAVKYSPDGSSVTVSAAADGPVVRLAVADTGTGIPPKDLQRIFERFYRVDAGRSRALGGTGLGLSIVKHLVEAMNGSIAVASVEGRGSTFTVSLPRGSS